MISILGESMKIAFVGSRTFSDKAFVQKKTEEYLHSDWIDYTNQVVHDFVSGGAIGVDSWAEEIAHKVKSVCHVILPDWEKHGKKAGFPVSGGKCPYCNDWMLRQEDLYWHMKIHKEELFPAEKQGSSSCSEGSGDSLHDVSS